MKLFLNLEYWSYINQSCILCLKIAYLRKNHHKNKHWGLFISCDIHLLRAIVLSFSTRAISFMVFIYLIMYTNVPRLAAFILILALLIGLFISFINWLSNNYIKHQIWIYFLLTFKRIYKYCILYVSKEGFLDWYEMGYLIFLVIYKVAKHTGHIHT